MQKKWRPTETAKPLPLTIASRRWSVLVCYSTSFRNSCSVPYTCCLTHSQHIKSYFQIDLFLLVLFCIFSNISNRLPKILIQIISKETFSIFFLFWFSNKHFDWKLEGEFAGDENRQVSKTGNGKSRKYVVQELISDLSHFLAMPFKFMPATLLTSWRSFVMTVTRLAWTAYRFATSKSVTSMFSVAS